MRNDDALPQYAGIWASSLRETLSQVRAQMTRQTCQQLIELLSSAQARKVTLLIEGE